MDNATFAEVSSLVRVMFEQRRRRGGQNPQPWHFRAAVCLTILLHAFVLPPSPHGVQVVQLAMWLETSKMDPELTGNLLGGGLLGDMLQSIEAAEQAVQEGHTAPSGEQVGQVQGSLHTGV